MGASSTPGGWTLCLLRWNWAVGPLKQDTRLLRRSFSTLIMAIVVVLPEKTPDVLLLLPLLLPRRLRLLHVLCTCSVQKTRRKTDLPPSNRHSGSRQKHTRTDSESRCLEAMTFLTSTLLLPMFPSWTNHVRKRLPCFARRTNSHSQFRRFSALQCNAIQSTTLSPN